MHRHDDDHCLLLPGTGECQHLIGLGPHDGQGQVATFGEQLRLLLAQLQNGSQHLLLDLAVLPGI